MGWIERVSMAYVHYLRTADRKWKCAEWHRALPAVPHGDLKKGVGEWERSSRGRSYMYTYMHIHKLS